MFLTLTAAVAAINNCEFAFSYSESNEQGYNGHRTDYDPTNDHYYMARRREAVLL